MKRPEDSIQRSVIRYLRLQYPKVVYMAIPNGGYRSKTEAAIMSGLGVVAGAPDLFIAHTDFYLPNSSIPRLVPKTGLFLELKSAKGRISANQQNMIWKLLKAGYECKIAYSFDEAKNLIDNYLK